MTATGNTTVIGDEDSGLTLPEHSDETKVTVPNDSPAEDERGKKYTLPYTFGQVENEAQAKQVCDLKEWSLVDFVNDALKAQARSNTYQRFMAKHKASKLSEDAMKERLIKNFIQMGFSEDAARAQVESALAAK